MSSSLHTADRNTHLKIVVVSMVAAIVVVAVGINARVADKSATPGAVAADGAPVKAGKPAIFTDTSTSTIR